MNPRDTSTTELSPQVLDACADEPIRIPGHIQPHGALLVVDPDTFVIRQASRNARDVLGLGDAGLIGAPLSVIPGADQLEAQLRPWLGSGEPSWLRSIPLAGRSRHVLAHTMPQGLIIEVEEGASHGAESLEILYPRLRRFMERVGGEEDVQTLCAAVAGQVRALTGFDRALVYRFDEAWNGTVIAEDGNGVLPVYMDLRFPASDIPEQARELYRLNRLRLIATAEYDPVPLEPVLSPVDGQPLDLSFAALRSVSPVHLEYMRNMGTWASMSVSLVLDGRLWGLIACHSAKPLHVPAHLRAACDFLAQLLSLQIGATLRLQASAERLALKSVQTGLVAKLAQEPNFDYGLTKNGEDWMKLTGAHGAAVLTPDALLTVGLTPPRDRIMQIVGHLPDSHSKVFVSDCLCRDIPGAEDISDTAAGVIAVSISQIHSSYLLWFRPEVVRTVTWGGDPRKPTDPEARLHPRKSFEQWKEQVRGCSLAWTSAEIESATEFRNAVLNFVLERAEERAELTDELTRANKELEAFSYSVSHDLRAPFRHIVGYAELLQDRSGGLDSESQRFLGNIIDAALSAGRLVDDLLAFSQTGRSSLHPTKVDMNKLMQEVRRITAPDTQGRDIEWRIGELPAAWGDPTMLRQALLNLVGNAIKYTKREPQAVITVSGEALRGGAAYTVSDNGVGFEMAYVGKLFGVFQRLHRTEDFEGTGIGLALTRGIIERHGGSIEAHGEVGAGATFRFTLPQKGKEGSLG